jgi:hypothetical protein
MMPWIVLPRSVVTRPHCQLSAALVLASSISAHAALPDATSEVSFRLTGQGFTEISSSGPQKYSPSHSYDTGRGSSWGGAATVETDEKGGRRFASVNAASVTLGTTSANAPGAVEASAILNYELMLVQVAPPPIPLLTVPGIVNVRASASATASGDPASNSAYAVAHVTIGSGVNVSVDALGENRTESESLARDFEVFYVPGQLIDVRLQSGAMVESGLNLGGPLATSARADAFADPVFNLDQEAFEDIARAQGFAPFDLAAYFAFEQSPFAAPIPEPSASVLMLLGGLLVAGACRRARMAGSLG